MKTETKEIYKCDFCRKLYQKKEACEKHELSCKRNPFNHRACHQCKILDKVNETIWSGVGDEYGCELEMTVYVLFCKKRDCFIYPPKVAHKGNAFAMDKENIEMPHVCEFQEKIEIL